MFSHIFKFYLAIKVADYILLSTAIRALTIPDIYICHFIVIAPIMSICIHIYRPITRSPTQFLQRKASCCRRAIYPTRELTIFVIFLNIVPMHTYLFLYFYRFSRSTRTYCKYPCVEMSNIEVFMGL